MAESTSGKDQKDDYDPYKNRDVQNPTTNFEAFVYLLKSSLGIGVIAMPTAFKNAGYINGITFTVIIGLTLLYAMHILLQTMYILCKRNHVPYMTYPTAMEAALEDGPPNLRWLSGFASCFVYGMLASYHFGINCVYVVFIAESIKQVTIETMKTDLDLRFYILAASVPLIVIYSNTTLKSLTALTILANLMQMFAFCTLFYFIDIHDDSKTVRHAFGNWREYPLFFGTVLFAVEAFGVIIAIEEQLKDPKSYLGFFGILNVAMVLVIIFNIAMGFMGYWKYGEEVRGSITLNLPYGDILSEVTKAVFAGSIAISYALQGYVTVDVIWNHYMKSLVDDYNYTRYELTLRAGIAIFSIFCAMLIPQFSEFLSLVGSFFLSILGMILPALMQYCVKYPDDYGRFNFIIIQDTIIMLFGFVGFLTGTYTGIARIFFSSAEDQFSSNFKQASILPTSDTLGAIP